MAPKWNFEKGHMSQLKRVKKQKGPKNALENAPKEGPENQNAIEFTPRLIEPVVSIYDLDNIKLSSVEAASVHSEFELDHLLLEGHCFEAFTGNPPRGMQLTLGTEQGQMTFGDGMRLRCEISHNSTG